MFTDQAAMRITQIMVGVHLHVRTCRCAPFPNLRNGWTDCGEIWCVVIDQLARLFAQVNDGAGAHGRTPFSYLGNGWTNYAEIWYAVRDSLAKRFTKVDASYVRTCSCTRG